MLLRISIKTFSLLALILFVFTANATNYYLSNSGNDANPGTDPSAPWQTLNKLNSFKNLRPGDNVLFKRGDSFYGSITVSNSGTAGNSITFSAYGVGENPVITGFTNVTKWTNLGNNIWESTDRVSTLSTCNMVLVNGVNTSMGRWPNSGYLTYQSHSGNNSITSSSLTGTPDWTGAGIVVRKNHFIIDRSNITSQSVGTLNYSIGSNYSPTKGFGFFIQNDIRTLDTANEWYYNKATNKISIYSKSSPNSVLLSTVDTLISISGKSNLSFDNIKFTGSNANSIIINNSTNIVILNCQFNFSGMDAVYAGTSSYLQISKSYFNQTNNNAISIGGVGAILKDSITNHISISEDTIKNTGTVAGMGKRKDEQTELTAILLQGSNNIIQNCVIDSTGYIPIWWRGNSSTIKNNFISTFGFIKDDGGGIYCWNYDDKPFVYSNQKILNNIILNGIGALQGSVPNPFAGASGLYFDGNAGGIEVEGNTISECTDDGILFHDAHDIVVKNNTLYNNGTQIAVYSDYTPMFNGDTSFVRNLYVTKNIFVSKTPEQYNLASIISFNDISRFGIIDSNFYARPLDNKLDCRADAIGGGLHFKNYSLSSWQAYSGFDLHSSNSIKKITDTSDLRFEYNATMVSKRIDLPFNYIDVKGTTFNGTIELPPFSSAILIKNGDVIDDQFKANAGSNQTVTLPVNSVKLTGSSTSADGNTLSYLWTNISGPIQCDITNINSASTSVTNLYSGVYEFELKVSNNNGTTSTDTVTITVIPALNVQPTANAGTNKTITLPVNTTTLSGSGTDGDGTIISYFWAKIAGPSNDNIIIDSNSAVTDVTGLTEGVYRFELKVTDNNGATAKDTVTITVNPQQNIPPQVNAGPYQTITLPVSSTIVTGSATDSDGFISNYSWEKISGPTNYQIQNADLAIATLSGLTEGIYQFQLTVTDDKGARATSTVQITVNQPLNIPPTAYADSNQTITLPINTVTLDGSGTDPDGTIASYSWTQIFGSSSGTINNANSASPTINNLSEGVYQFELKVTDDKGDVGRDTVQITVNAAPNIQPTANAGVDKTITLPTNSVSLFGSGTDSNGSIASYSWTQISGPANGSINNANSASVTVNNLFEGIYQFELKVADDKETIGRDTVQITVNAAANIPPTANAGTDKTITLPTNSVSLSGSGTDSDGTISSYSWTKISGPSAFSISNSSAAITTVSALLQGVYLFELKVTDDKGAIGLDTVQITVNRAPNLPPTANAGADKTITLPTASVSLSGSGTDPDGTIASYSWTQIFGPTSGSINNTNSASATISDLSEGVYEFEFNVTDDKGAIGRDTVQITVNAAANVPPTVIAGSDQTITLPTNSVSLSGNGTDSDGTISSYSWTKIFGPSVYVISSSSSAVTTVSELVQGIYQFQLKVTDDKGAVSKDTVQITVNAAPNIPPTANAGADQTITLRINSVSLSGNGTDSDGTISSYSWTKISGPSAYNISYVSSAVTTVSGLAGGVYLFELKVTDDKGAIGRDTIQITVNAAPNIPPTAYAGADKTITLPTNSVLLSGSGTDSDGTVSSYLWTKIYGPNPFNIQNPSTSAVDITGLVQGVYLFELQVTDNKGALARDTVKIIVNPAKNIAPIAQAGVNQTITLPINTITLNGSGTDSDGKIVSYLWTKMSGADAFVITDASSASTTVKGLIQGFYIFTLTVTDNQGATATDTLAITVNAAKNIPPKANAGADQTITLPENSIRLNGIGKDSDGTVSSFLWEKISGPDEGIISDSSLASTTLTELTAGNYIFKLTVTDNEGAKGVDSVNVIVNAAENVIPTSNAGPDITVVLPINSVYLNGSGNDTDGTITAYKWKQISGPDTAIIATDNKASTVVKNLASGTYEFELAVTDNKGETGKDTVRVVVALERTSAESNSIKIYPNPVKEIATVEITSENTNSRLMLIISDFSGKIVYKKQINSTDHKTIEKINMSTFSSGNYALSVFFDDKDKQVLTIIKQ